MNPFTDLNHQSIAWLLLSVKPELKPGFQPINGRQSKSWLSGSDVGFAAPRRKQSGLRSGGNHITRESGRVPSHSTNPWIVVMSEPSHCGSVLTILHY